MAQSSKDDPISSVEDPRYVKALAHPLRVRILSMLEERDASPVQLAEHLDATLGTVAYHVRTLERLGLIEMVATHQRRGATEHVYAAREHPRFSSATWQSTHPMTKHVMVASALSEIGEYAAQSAAAGGFDHPESNLNRTALSLDAEGWTELADATRRWQEEVAAIEKAAAKRLRKTDEKAMDAGLVVMLFEATPFFGARDGDGPADAAAG
jgi:DNA-binding transcriptional ArsR family regulator